MNRNYSEKVHDNIMSNTDDWLKEFKRTNYFCELTKAQQSVTNFIIKAFTEMNYTYQLRRPSEWTEVSLNYVLSDVFPKKIIEKKSFFKNVEAILMQYFLFLGETDRIKNSDALIVSLEESTDALIELANEEKKGEVGKVVMSEGDTLGFDIRNEAEVANFINIYNKLNK